MLNFCFFWFEILKIKRNSLRLWETSHRFIFPALNVRFLIFMLLCCLLRKCKRMSPWILRHLRCSHTLKTKVNFVHFVNQESNIFFVDFLSFLANPNNKVHDKALYQKWSSDDREQLKKFVVNYGYGRWK